MTIYVACLSLCIHFMDMLIHNFGAGVSVEMVVSRRDMLLLDIKRILQQLWYFRHHDNSSG